MTQAFNLYLVRHAQSEANVNGRVLKSKTNVGVSLTQKGEIQAQETGGFLSQKLKHLPIKIWNSPYERTRKTALAIKNTLKQQHVHFEEEESIYLAERQFGLLDDANDYANSHATELAHYKLHSDEKREFFARPPLGESPFDMCMRLDFFLRCVLPESDAFQHVIVSHGAAVRGLIVMNQKLPYERYLEMPNPANASVHFIEGGHHYKGEIFKPGYASY